MRLNISIRVGFYHSDEFYFRRKINVREGQANDIISNGGKNGRQMERLMRPSVKINSAFVFLSDLGSDGGGNGGGGNDRSCFIFRANHLSDFAYAINIESKRR